MHTTEKEVVQELLSKTRAGQRAWEKTSVSDQFELRMSSARVLIDAGVQHGHQFYRLRITDSSATKTVVDVLGHEGTQDYQLLGQLYSAAEDAFYASNDTLSGVFRELKAS